MKLCPPYSAVKRLFLALTGSAMAVAALLVLAAGSIALACVKAKALPGIVGVAAFVIGAFVFSQFLVVVTLRAWRRLPATCLHLGLALALGGWAVNAWAHATGEVPPSVAVPLRERDFAPVGNAFQIALKTFTIDSWPDTGTIRQYTSRVHLLPLASSMTRADIVDATISVNHPGRYHGWWIYQSDYGEWTDPDTGDAYPYTVLRCVKDIGLPFAAAGGALLVIGAFLYAVVCWKRGGAR